MTDRSQVTITGHADQWVALINNVIVASSSSFPALVKILEARKIENKATVTHVSGTNVIL